MPCKDDFQFGKMMKERATIFMIVAHGVSCLREDRSLILFLTAS